MLRTVAKNVSVTEEYRKLHENLYEVLVESTFKNFGVQFRENEEFTEKTVDGRKVRTIMFFEDGKLIQIQKKMVEGEGLRTEREFIGDELIMTYYINGKVVAKRYFEAV